MILANESVEMEKKLAEWLPGTAKWGLCWRGTEHGWEASIFHKICDEIKPSLVIVKVVTGGKTETWGGSKFEYIVIYIIIIIT
jgi:hypothetical protein